MLTVFTLVSGPQGDVLDTQEIVVNTQAACHRAAFRYHMNAMPSVWATGRSEQTRRGRALHSHGVSIGGVFWQREVTCQRVDDPAELSRLNGKLS